MKKLMRGFCNRIGAAAATTLLAIIVLHIGGAGSSAIASPLTTQPVIAYNIDFGMDLARVEQTIEHYGEEIREVVEQALMNNVNHPESKDTAENTYQRQSALNDILPERRNSAFSKDDLTNLRKTEHPRDRLR
ncbi:MAG: hypothetical protein ACFB16_22570 [Phormidesmis sp.]